MPGSSQAPLTDEGLAAVLNWIMDSFYDADGLTPYSAEEVGRYRAEPLLDPLKQRERLLSDAPPVSR